MGAEGADPTRTVPPQALRRGGEADERGGDAEEHPGEQNEGRGGRRSAGLPSLWHPDPSMRRQKVAREHFV